MQGYHLVDVLMGTPLRRPLKVNKINPEDDQNNANYNGSLGQVRLHEMDTMYIHQFFTWGEPEIVRSKIDVASFFHQSRLGAME